MDGFVDRLHALRFLRACDPSYRALTFTLVGLPPLDTSAFSWTYCSAPSSRVSGRQPECTQVEGADTVTQSSPIEVVTQRRQPN